MSSTFKMKIIRDKAKPWQEDIKEITNKLRARGYTPQGFERDDNYFTIGGTYEQNQGSAD